MANVFEYKTQAFAIPGTLQRNHSYLYNEICQLRKITQKRKFIIYHVRQ